MAPPVLRPLSAGEILDVSFTLYRRHFSALATVALICAGVPLVLRLLLDNSHLYTPTREGQCNLHPSLKLGVEEK